MAEFAGTASQEANLLVRAKGVPKAKIRRSQLVQATAERMRILILGREPNTQVGSLPEIARQFDVGIVTVQQAARILEHEGLLEVRRGPGGGYYGKRPDDAALARSMAAYLRVHASNLRDAVEMSTVLTCELTEAASRCTDEAHRESLRVLSATIEERETAEQQIAFDKEFHEVLYKMASRPLFEILLRVTMRHYETHQEAYPIPVLASEEYGGAAWKERRSRMIRAILQQDEELARFEATRYRQYLLKRLRASLPAG